MRNIVRVILWAGVYLLFSGLTSFFADDESSGTGTEFVVSPDGYSQTCAHVLKHTAEVRVVLEIKFWDTAANQKKGVLL